MELAKSAGKVQDQVLSDSRVEGPEMRSTAAGEREYRDVSR